MIGRVISAHGRHYQVRLDSGAVYHSYMRGKKTGVCVGDYVVLSLHGQEASIESIQERRNLLYRSDESRSKQFAANVEQLLVVVAVQPPFSDDLLARALTGAWSAQIKPIILLNKTDLEDGLTSSLERLHIYKTLQVPIVLTSTLDRDQLKARLLPLLQGKTSLLLGQSAMGKSSILNVLVPSANAHTQEHSVALGTGKHTTTSTTLYAVPEVNGFIIDSPGFQTFGIKHLGQSDIVRGFPEFAPFIQHCKFYNCTHLHEPGCGVLSALKEQQVNPKRHQLYTRMLAEIQAPEKY